MKKSVMFVTFVLCIFLVSAQQNFDVGSILLKVSAQEGKSLTKTISIKSDEGGLFIADTNVQGLKITEREFNLNMGETKNLELVFDSSGLNPGIYVGSVNVRSQKDKTSVPVIFEVESADLFFDSNLDIPPQYSQIAPGERLVANMKIFDLVSSGTSEGLGASKIDVEYIIYNFLGEIVSSESESLVVDRQTQLTKTIALPGKITEGQYVFVTLVKYKGSVGVASYVFSVGKNGSFDFFSGEFDLKFFAILFVIVLFFLALIFLFVYMIRDRDKILRELRGYNRHELANQKKMLGIQKKYLIEARKTPKPVVRKQIKEKIIYLKEKQNKRVKEIKKIRKSGDVEAMKKKLKEWRAEGYDFNGSDYRLPGLSDGEMKKLLLNWKKSYKGV